MKRLFKNLHVSENLEVLFMLILGILLQMADGSHFSMKERWKLVWETELPASHFNPLVQRIIKTVLSMIVVVRCATTYAYVVSAMLVMFCLLRNTAPKLMLLWLLVAGAKSICMTILEALTGVYVCSAFGKIRKACIEFFISKSLEIALQCVCQRSTHPRKFLLDIGSDRVPALAEDRWHMPHNMRRVNDNQNMFNYMERKAEEKRMLQDKEEIHIQKIDFCRQRARSLVDESTLYKTACLNNFEFKDVPQIILQMLRPDAEMSQDSLLCPGMMLASVSNLGSFDHLKASQSLGELGFVDLETTQVVGLEEDENLTHQEKALRFLKLSKSDVQRITLNKSTVGNDIYTIDRDTWNQMEASGQHINKPKHRRTQVFIHDIPQAENYDDRSKARKKSFEYNFNFSISSSFSEWQSSFEEERDEEFIFSHEEDDDDTPQLVMSNLKEGVIGDQSRFGIVLKRIEGNEYARLYRQDFMSVIGPEVFDKACKLPKVTSLTKLYVTSQLSTTVSLPEILDLNGETNSKSDLGEKTSEVSLEISQLPNDEEPPGRDLKLSTQTNSTEEEVSLPDIVYNLKEEPDASESGKKLDSDDSEHSKMTNEDSVQSLERVEIGEKKKSQPKVFYRKRRIIIKRIGGPRKGRNWFWKTSSDTQRNSTDCDPEPEGKPDLDTEKEETREKPEDPKKPTSQHQKNRVSPGVSSTNKTVLGDYNQPTYFLTELLQKPLLDVLTSYYDLKKKIYIQRKPSSFYKEQDVELCNIPIRHYSLRRHSRTLQSLDSTATEAKVWKSKVLKTAEVLSRENSVITLRSVINIIKRESVLRRLFKYEYARLMRKNKKVYNGNNEVLFSRSNRDDPEKLSNLAADSFDNRTAKKKESEISLKSDTETSDVCPHEEKLSEMVEAPSKNIIAADKDTNVEEPIKEVTGEREAPLNDTEKESICSQESDEPISLYYSKAANLASPLFDMKRFIYPDHIHYSYKHVRKEGFDVDINGGFPLLVRESLTRDTPVEMGSSKHPESEITRRPMDLSFASSNAFAEWQTNDQTDVDAVLSAQKCDNSCSNKERNPSDVDLNKNKKTEKTKRSKKNSGRNENHRSLKYDFNKSKSKPHEGNLSNLKYLYSTKDYALIEKLLKMHVQFNSKEYDNRKNERKPIHITSAQLHSNKGRINSTFNPAIFLQENRSRTEKKKVETQEERTKDMFARLEREVLLQSKVVHKSFGPNRSP